MSRIIQIEIGENGASVRLEGTLKLFSYSSKERWKMQQFVNELLTFIGENIIDPDEFPEDAPYNTNYFEVSVYADFLARPVPTPLTEVPTQKVLEIREKLNLQDSDIPF